MPIRKIRMRPEGTDDYETILHPETNTSMVQLIPDTPGTIISLEEYLQNNIKSGDAIQLELSSFKTDVFGQPSQFTVPYESYVSKIAKYQKFGKMVTLMFEFEVDNDPDRFLSLIIMGLPFAPDQTQGNAVGTLALQGFENPENFTYSELLTYNGTIALRATTTMGVGNVRADDITSATATIRGVISYMANY